MFVFLICSLHNHIHNHMLYVYHIICSSRQIINFYEILLSFDKDDYVY